MKSIEDLKPRGVERERGLPNRRASYQDVESASSERYKGFVVRYRLKKVLDEAVKSKATANEEEVRRFPGRYIDSVKCPDGRVL